MESMGIPSGPARGTHGVTQRWMMIAAGLALALSPAIAEAQARRDFLFRAPTVTFNLRTGYNLARAGGDVFDFTRENLTLERGDFGAFTIGGDVGVRLAPQLDLVLGFSHAGTSVRSEFRDWVDQDDLPIEQRTRFSVTPLTAGLRYYLVPRGRQVGRFVWIPTQVTPYIGASVGAVYYSFEQTGDWVDFEDLSVFFDRLESKGWTRMAQAVGGVEVGLTPFMALVGEGRLSVASAEPERDFVGFDGIDLSGLQVTVGLSFRM
jgi:hypothetical protein